MANTLFIDVEARFAKFSDSLNAIQRDTSRFAGSLDSSFRALGVTLGSLAGVLSIGTFTAWTKQFIDFAADLDDMAEKTGASVEELSKLSQQAYISGVSLESLETALVQLNKHLHGSGEESQNTTRALEALGLSAAELKNLDPAQALRVVAVELNKFADGGGKAALAIDLMGKAGAQQLPILKDIANESEKMATVTAEQAAAAEELGKSWRRLSLEAKNFGQSLALDIVPWLTRMVERMQEAARIGGGGFLNGLRVLAQQGNAFAQPADNLKKLREELERLEASQAALPAGSSSPFDKMAQRRIGIVKEQIEWEKALQRQQALSAGSGDTPGERARMGVTGKPTLDYKAATAATAARAAAVQKQMSLDELMVKAELKRLEQYEETEREMSRIADREAEERRKIHEKELNDSLTLAQRIQRADVEAHQYLQKEMEGFSVAPVYLDDTKHKIDEISDSSRDMAHVIGTAFEDAILEGKKFSDVLEGLAQDIARIILRMTVTKPLENAIGTIGNQFFGSLFGGSTSWMAYSAGNDGNAHGALLGAYAGGTDYVPRTGAYLLHQGESVIPAGENGRSIDARSNIVINNPTQESIPGIVAALNNHERRIQNLDAGDGYRRSGATRRIYR